MVLIQPPQPPQPEGNPEGRRPPPNINVVIEVTTARNNILYNENGDIVQNYGNHPNPMVTIPDGEQYTIITIGTDDDPDCLSYWLGCPPTDSDPDWFDDEISVSFDVATRELGRGAHAYIMTEDWGPIGVRPSSIFDAIERELVNLHNRGVALPGSCNSEPQPEDDAPAPEGFVPLPEQLIPAPLQREPAQAEPVRLENLGEYRNPSEDLFFRRERYGDPDPPSDSDSEDD
jgi:hypothetical protein